MNIIVLLEIYCYIFISGERIYNCSNSFEFCLSRTRIIQYENKKTKKALKKKD